VFGVGATAASDEPEVELRGKMRDLGGKLGGTAAVELDAFVELGMTLGRRVCPKPAEP
jgi:hypothetical protein